MAEALAWVGDERGEVSESEVLPSIEGETRKGLFSRARAFLHDISVELRKVIWPTRRELSVYTTVVIIFLLFITAFITLLDFGFGQITLFLFGS
ncbi:MAG: preprotein translocase subunit SecE [Actinobacteria bacterium]|nr:preprotein translocase subunit SecE [Actinomycetota bacterium]